ncbi:MAG: HD domain-containing protein [Clostridia bacterium]|nr:HD domain-containing protein [Clostridia bacterium]
MSNKKALSKELNEIICENNRLRAAIGFGFSDEKALRRSATTDSSRAWNSPFISDVDTIMHCPYFSRYADKTQVFSLYKNDDMTRRSLHVQLVSRISRTIGRALGLNLELIEAIALGHDVGHPAFAHTGEKLLDELYYQHTGRRFLHNIHSVRVLDKIHAYDLTLQTLNGIASHNGEMELDEYRPVPIKSFAQFDEIMEKCALDKKFADKIMPCTLEGAVVRISDIIAYLGKDRQDAILAKAVQESDFTTHEIGVGNAEMVDNLIVNVIENSYGKPYIKLDSAHFDALRKAKKENYEKIYNHSIEHTGLKGNIQPMMEEVYNQLLDDVKGNVQSSPIFTHHIRQVNQQKVVRETPYEKTEANQLVVDYIASMTDDYFIELHERLFPNSAYKLRYKGYFDE